MRIRLLGTGSADGWPNPFCDCPSCAAERRDGRSRRPSSALVDDVLLIDCGPTTPHLPPPVTLQQVRHVLITHGHPDHLHPAFLLSRSWVAGAGPLDVWGPPRALDLCRDWLAPDSLVRLNPVEPGATMSLTTPAGEYRVTALPAAHAHGDGDVLALEALLFAIDAPDRSRLLYATDTGPLPTDTMAMIGGRVDAVLIDETFGDHRTHGTGHHDLGTLPGTLDALRDSGVIDDSTQVVATHLSHHNPSSRELRPRLEVLGVNLPDDLDVIDTAHRRRGRHTLVLGGARSGKSTFAEQRAAQHGAVTYLATGGARPDDAEWAERVAAHRARRPESWRTVESTDVAAHVRTATSGDVLLVDCLALWLTAVLDDADAWRPDAPAAEVRAEALRAVDDLVEALDSSPATVILVSNEVGMGVVPATASGRLFRDLLGITNARVADACDETVLVVAGRAITLADDRSGFGGPRG